MSFLMLQRFPSQYSFAAQVPTLAVPQLASRRVLPVSGVSLGRSLLLASACSADERPSTSALSVLSPGACHRISCRRRIGFCGCPGTRHNRLQIPSMPSQIATCKVCRAYCCASPATFVAFMCMGSASWLTVNAVFAEMPLIAAVAPEGWKLAAELGFAIQIANIFAIIYLFLRRCCVKRAAEVALARFARQRREHGYSLFESLIQRPGTGAQDVLSSPPHIDATDAEAGVAGAPKMPQAKSALQQSQAEPLPRSSTLVKSQLLAAEARASLNLTGCAILVILGVGMLATVLLALVWRATAGDAEHSWSLPLLTLALVAGAVDCVSTVTFWPFASRFPPQMTTALAVGEGLSGLIPGVLAIPQAVQLQQSQSVSDVSFGVLEFMLCMVAVLGMATAGFVFLFFQATRDPVELRLPQTGSAGSGDDVCRDLPVCAAGAASASAGAASAFEGVSGSVPSHAEHDDGKDKAVGPLVQLERLPGSESGSPPDQPTAAPSAVTPGELSSGDGSAAGTVLHLAKLLQRHALLLCLLVCLSFVQNGAMVAVLPYAAAPLDPRAPESGKRWHELQSSNPGIVLQWANTCGLLADPLGALLTLSVGCRRASLRLSGVLSGIWVVALLCVLGLALAGPYAQWGGSALAGVLLAAVYAAARFAMGLQRAQLFLAARGGGLAVANEPAEVEAWPTVATRHEEREEALTATEEKRRDAAAAVSGERVSLLAGAATQLGACVGSLLFAILVTDTNVFHQREDAGL